MGKGQVESYNCPARFLDRLQPPCRKEELRGRPTGSLRGRESRGSREAQAMKTHRTKCQNGEDRAQGESPGDPRGGPSGTQQGAINTRRGGTRPRLGRGPWVCCTQRPATRSRCCLPGRRVTQKDTNGLKRNNRPWKYHKAKNDRTERRNRQIPSCRQVSRPLSTVNGTSRQKLCKGVGDSKHSANQHGLTDVYGTLHLNTHSFPEHMEHLPI